MLMRNKILIICALIITFISQIITDNSLVYKGKVKSLVLIDDWHYLDTHSMLWDQLRSKLNYLIR